MSRYSELAGRMEALPQSSATILSRTALRQCDEERMYVHELLKTLQESVRGTLSGTCNGVDSPRLLWDGTRCLCDECVLALALRASLGDMMEDGET
jgi:hypothetical protein